MSIASTSVGNVDDLPSKGIALKAQYKSFYLRHGGDQYFCMQVKDVMTTTVITVTPFTPVREVAKLLVERRLRGVPVVECGELVGVVSESDLLQRHEIGTDVEPSPEPWWSRWFRTDRHPRRYVRTHGRRARDVMSRRPVCVADDAALPMLARLFERHRVGSIPVLRNGHVVGVVTRADLLRALAAGADGNDEPCAGGDDAIRRRLLAELQRQPWWQSHWAAVSVHGGVVSFRGLVESEAARNAARVAAENIPGVRGVEDDRTVSSEWQPAM